MPESRLHLIVTVHGIRTYGYWQERLERLVSDRTARHETEFVNFKFGYFSVLSFTFPPARWLLVRRFGKELLRLCTSQQGERIDLVGHSFGTHLIAWAVAGLAEEIDIKFHSVVLAGSVLKSDFPWHQFIGSRIGRVINDCGPKDGILLLSQFLVFFTGMAGRVGFIGSTSANLRNRYSVFGHSGYFLDANGKPSDDYLLQHWVPLLCSEVFADQFDLREPPTTGDAILESLASYAGLIKAAVYMTPLALLLIVYYNLYVEAEHERKTAIANESRAMTALAGIGSEEQHYVDAIELSLAARPRANRPTNRPRLEATLQSLSRAISRQYGLVRAMEHPSVTGAILSPDERQILSWSKDGLLKVWNIDGGRPSEPPMKHNGPINGAFSFGGGQRILSWSEDHTLRFWDASTLRQVGPPSHGESVTGALLLKDGRRIVSWSGDTISVWDVTSRQAHHYCDETRWALYRASWLLKTKNGACRGRENTRSSRGPILSERTGSFRLLKLKSTLTKISGARLEL
jgi:hypothetical protein